MGRHGYQRNRNTFHSPASRGTTVRRQDASLEHLLAFYARALFSWGGGPASMALISGRPPRPLGDSDCSLPMPWRWATACLPIGLKVSALSVIGGGPPGGDRGRRRHRAADDDPDVDNDRLLFRIKDSPAIKSIAHCSAAGGCWSPALDGLRHGSQAWFGSRSWGGCCAQPGLDKLAIIVVTSSC